MRRKKIVIGITEVANFINDYAIALKGAGYTVDTIVYGTNPYYSENRYSYNINRYMPRFITRIKFVRGAIRKLLYYIQSISYFFFFLFRYDIFIYVWSQSYLPFHIDWIILRLLGRKAIILHCGSDVRYRPIHYTMGQQLKQNDILKNVSDDIERQYYNGGGSFFNTFFYQKTSEWSQHIVLSQCNQATFGREYIFARFPTRELIPSPRITNDVVKIIHAPTNNVFKRSDIVLKAIDLLEERCPGKFSFEKIQGKDNSYVLNTLLHTDIVIDQPSDWIGRLGSEALAAGCVVLGGNNTCYENGAPKDSPVIQFIADAESLADNLQRLIEDKASRQSIMNQSYHFWLKYYSPGAFVIWFNSMLKKQIPMVETKTKYREILIDSAENLLQRSLIKLFY